MSDHDRAQAAERATKRGIVTQAETLIGLAVVGVGFYMRTRKKYARLYSYGFNLVRSKESKLYSYTARPGETVRIKVVRGTDSLADTTVGG